MSKDERWKKLLSLAGVEEGPTMPDGRAPDPIASQLSFLLGRPYLHSLESRQSIETGQFEFSDSGLFKPPNEDQSRILTDHVAQLSKQILDLKQATERQTISTDNNTIVTQDNTMIRAQNPLHSAAAGIGRTLSGIGSGLTLSPLVKHLTGLFRGEALTGEPSPLPLYVPPAPIRAGGAISPKGDVINEVSHGQAGLPRRSGGEYGNSIPPITIQVNAIDSRSFMDHSEGIARAVREAMLNMHAINDVIADL